MRRRRNCFSGRGSRAIHQPNMANQHGSVKVVQTILLLVPPNAACRYWSVRVLWKASSSHAVPIPLRNITRQLSSSKRSSCRHAQVILGMLCISPRRTSSHFSIVLRHGKDSPFIQRTRIPRPASIWLDRYAIIIAPG
jgi:hypothetical protein